MTKKIDHTNAHSLCKLFLTSKRSICAVVDSNKEARLLYNELDLYLNSDLIDYFPENEILPYDHFSSPESILKERFRILNSEKVVKKILITTIKNLFERFPPIGFFKSIQNLKIADKLSIEQLVNTLDDLSYEKVNRIESINQYSLRGGIIDVYTPIYNQPLRIEIFDDQVESIRQFDPDSQLSTEKLTNFSLTKGALTSLDSSSLKIFKDNWRRYFQDYDERQCEIFQKLNNGNSAEGSEIYLPLLFNQTSTFFELFNSYDFIKSSNMDNLVSEYYLSINQRYEDENIDIQRPLLKPSDMFINQKTLLGILKKVKQIKSSDGEFKYEKFEDLIGDISTNKIEFKKIILITSINSEFELLVKKFLPNLTQPKDIKEAKEGINIMMGELVRPFHNKEKDILIVHREYFKSTNVIPLSNKPQIRADVNNSSMFKAGDLVIHENYGLGQYEGLEIVTANDISNEYLKIIYSSNESLYVPLRSVDLVSKYHKNNGINTVQFDSLSSARWIKNKEKATKRAFDHAAEILDVESRRLGSSSVSLKIDDKAFEEFTNEFPYTETHDQIDAISHIRKDLTLIKPMNRLLCGDVGFGKTEVAMRAAYISIFSNKQVIVLSPSTVLANQHYESFLDRFKKFPVNIQLLNRHTKAKSKELIVNSFNNGEVDILIGTHAIFTSGLVFKNTGLLVVDEEHKFGIKQKDIIKGKQENIHILYLSATPIPRTMNFIFSGLKEFSFLHTPPTNRVSIKSFLKIQKDQLLKEAISREISRGGQCFIVQNDISKMEYLKKQILELVPGSSIGIAHGKLKKEEISSVMSNFDIGNLDVLICTTIVEMGLDIPNANTILIIDSHNFGLSQLHQLRGRVGRSNRQGYCYFLIPTTDLPKLSKERLDSIIRLSDLGSGFFIAQEDLEIRGGGEMLGDKQSGHVNTIGLSLYLSMLKNALQKFKTNSEEDLIQTEINFYDSSYISDSYLPSPLERLKVYKDINNVESKKSLEEIKNNLEDRCGSLPIEVGNLINNAEINLMIKNTGITKISSNSSNTSLLLSTSVKKDIFEKLLALLTNDPVKYSINKDNKFNINLIEDDALARRIFVKKLINEII
jgi:transcription-repair coupling factor (superfamily II helicase)